MPQYAAGMRIEPPVSVPSAKSQTPAATSAAEPLLEPPDVRLASSGLKVMPYAGLTLPAAYSSRFVLQRSSAPAVRRRATTGGIAPGGRRYADGGGVRGHDAANVDVVLDRHGHAAQRPVDALVAPARAS